MSVSAEDLASPSFRRGYALLWLGIVLVLGVALTHLIPTGELKGCTVTSPVESIEVDIHHVDTSCGSFVSFSVMGPRDLQQGSTYDLQMRGVFVRYIDTWTPTEGV